MDEANKLSRKGFLSAIGSAVATSCLPLAEATIHVWVDWEHRNEVDNVSEIILLRGVLEAAA
jgi:hypothetical protein